MFLTAECAWESRKSETQNTLTVDIDDYVGEWNIGKKVNFVWVGR